MGLFEQFPFTNFHEMNLDWIVENIKELKSEYDTGKIDYNNFKTEVYQKFDNILSEPEIEKVLDEMVANGDLNQILNSFVGAIQMAETIADIKSRDYLTEGAIFQTEGYNAINDGGSGCYRINKVSANGIPLKNGFFAHYIPLGNSFNMKAAGGTDTTIQTQTMGCANFAFNQASKYFGYISEFVFPSGQYVFLTPVIIGTGDNGSNPSSVNGVHLRGIATDGQLKTEFIFGNIGNNPGIIVNGKFYGFSMENILMTLNGISSGLELNCIQNSYLRNVDIRNPIAGGTCLKIMGGHAPTGNYCINNSFENIACAAILDNTTCLELDGILVENGNTVSNDIWLTTFDTCRFDTYGSNCVAGRLKFCDNISFMRCHFVNSAHRDNSRGIYLDSTGMIGGNSYPSGLGFYSCSISSVYSFVPEGCSQGINYYIAAGVDDNETLPTQANAPGITAHGVPFNGWGSTGGQVLNGPYNG